MNRSICTTSKLITAVLGMKTITKMFSSLSIMSSNLATLNVSCAINSSTFLQSSRLHITIPRPDLMNFFDSKENWGANEVKVGRAWKKAELRIKSNSDLHKLWFVLLKERNMLLSMEHEANEKVKLFPSPERIDKIKESMQNLESVVRERNEAYFQLETGESGERPGMVATNPLGLRYYHRKSEHIIPQFMNTKWRLWNFIGVHRGCAVKRFLKLYREKLSVAKRKAINRQRNHVMQLLKRFPKVNPEALHQQFPDVDLQKVADNKKIRGHHNNSS